jgi:hypothetical protein
MRSSVEIVGCFLCILCCGVKGRPAIEHRVVSYPIVLRSVQVVHGKDPLHVAVLLSRREDPLAIIDSFLACVFTSWGSSFEWICTSKYEGSGVSKYDGMRWIRRCVRISGNPMITSMQLSITLAVIPRKILSDFITS